MILQVPQIIAIDDELGHLVGLTKGLNEYGLACLPIHFVGDAEGIKPNSHVRVIFLDLHLIAGNPPGNHHQDFSIIASLIENKIAPRGPYFIVLWTMFPKQAEELAHFLEERLETATKPFTIKPLDKSEHLDDDGNVRDIEKLCESIAKIIDEQPQVGALLDWESQVLGATADTLSSIVKLAESTPGKRNLNGEVEKLLACLASAAAGEEHVEEDKFRAVNEALLPILADRIASLRPDDNEELWQNAFRADASKKLSPDKAAKLNSLLHIELPAKKKGESRRGDVIALPEELSGEMFEQTFNLNQADAAYDEFWCQGFDETSGQFFWVLVQSQAACDYAQKKPGPLPYSLGLCLPTVKVRKDTKSTALWASPSFEFNDVAYSLHVNARFQTSLSSASKKIQLLFRLREQILSDLMYRLLNHRARPGMIQFRETK